jgi:hypothetical protein
VRGGRRLGEACYVLVIVAGVAVAMSDPNHPRRSLCIVMLVACLPGSVGAFPFLYVAVPLAWNLTHADSGGVTWPVTAAYAAVGGLAAVANIILLRGRLDRRRTA